ncbi:hypothetical protein tb265_06810 [Gemmatimonadetes bacterium T265]|nr:hypothetical protein tb265_06810 [Gemmatimonadetes bacterium T265]
MTSTGCASGASAPPAAAPTPRATVCAICAAVAAATTVHGRAVSMAEIADAMGTDARALFGTDATWRVTFSRCVVACFERGALTSPGKRAWFRYYALPGTPEATAGLPTEPTASERVLDVVRNLVRLHGRAVRPTEVAAAAAATWAAEAGCAPEQVRAASFNNVVVHLRRLVADGRVREVAGPTAGHHHAPAAGRRLYLPSDLPEGAADAPSDTSFRRAVEDAAGAVWADRVGAAQRLGGKPRPMSTTDVRRELETAERWSTEFVTTRVVHALLACCRRNQPALRQVDRGDARLHLFVPAYIADDDVDLSPYFLNDAERSAEAVCRACARLGVPAVPLGDVAEEVRRDHTLAPEGRYSLSAVLSGSFTRAAAARAGTPPADASLAARVRPRVARIGAVGYHPYYGPADDLAAATRYVQRLNIEERWRALAPTSSLVTALAARVPAVRVGRALLLRDELRLLVSACESDAARPRTGKDEAETVAWAALRGSLERDQDEIDRAVTGAAAGAPSTTQSGRGVESASPIPGVGMLGSEVQAFARPIWRVARTIPTAGAIANRLRHAVRLLRNPDYRNPRAQTERERATTLLDRTEVLLYAATEWGGPQARLHGVVARGELGALRDLRFVLPGFEHPDFEVRIAAAACLAFLGHDPAAAPALQAAAEHDPDAGVRQAALWALGIAVDDAGYAAALAFLRRRAVEDPSVWVREFAVRGIDAVTRDDGRWWRM